MTLTDGLPGDTNGLLEAELAEWTANVTLADHEIGPEAGGDQYV